MRRTARRAKKKTDWLGIYATLMVRSGRRCERPFCRSRQHLEVHHVVKRSQGGPDHEDNLTVLCRACHVQTDAPYPAGRLVITPQGGGRFLYATEFKSPKPFRAHA